MRKMSMADGENRRMINMVEVTNDFFETIAKEFKSDIGTLKPYKAYEEERELLMLRLSDFDTKLRELSEKVEELKSQIAEVTK